MKRNKKKQVEKPELEFKFEFEKIEDFLSPQEVEKMSMKNVENFLKYLNEVSEDSKSIEERLFKISVLQNFSTLCAINIMSKLDQENFEKSKKCMLDLILHVQNMRIPKTESQEEQSLPE